MVNFDAKTARELVDSLEYQRILQKLTDSVGMLIESEYEEILAEFDAEILRFSGLELKDIKSFITLRGGDLLAYSINKFCATDKAAIEQEYPAGEGPDEDDGGEGAGGMYSQGLLIMNSIEILLLEQGMQSLISFLKMARIPKAGTYAKAIDGFIQ